VEASDRLVPIVDDLVRALHQVVEEHRVTEPELRQALQFLAEVGAADEWVLLSDVLGISVAVDNQTYRREGDETPANVQGPFYRPSAPLAAPPVSLCRDEEPGDPCFVAGRVLAAGDRRPLEGALLDVWQTNQAGLYDHEDPDQPEWNLRRRFHAGADGAYEFRTVVPGPYEIPQARPGGPAAGRGRPARLAASALPREGRRRRLPAADHHDLPPGRPLAARRHHLLGQARPGGGARQARPAPGAARPRP
jgi:catechol 1,2-dioxygenase